MAGDDLVVSGIELDARETLREINRLDRQLRGLEDQVDEVTDATDRADRTMRGMGRTIAGAAAAFGAFQAAERAAGFILQTNKEFQQLEARLVSVTGSTEKAAQAFDLIKDFAQETPFQIQGLLESFTQLQLRGIEPTRDMMRDLGNFAAAFGKDLTQLTNAILRAAQGGTERLREGFGIPIEKQGEQIEIAFQGTRKVVEAEAGAMVQAFRELAEENFGEAMSRQMDTLVGSLSNLEDTASVAASKVGEQGLNDAIQDLAGTIDQAIADNDEFAKSLGENLASGVGKADEALQLFVEHTEALVQALEVLVDISVVRLLAGMVTKFAAAETAALGFKAALGGIPGIAATVLGGLHALTNEVDETSEATERLAERMDELTDSMAEMSAQQIRSKMASVRTALDVTEARIDRIDQQIEQAADESDASGRLGLDVQGAQEIAGLKSQQSQLEQQADTLRETLGQLRNQLLETGDAASEAGEGSEDAAEGASRQAEEIDELLESLREERDELKFTEKELLKKELRELGASEATIQQAVAIQEKIEALEDEAEAQEEAAEAEEERIENAKRRREQAREEVQKIHDRARKRQRRFASELTLQQMEKEIRRVERFSDAIGEAFADATMSVITESESMIDAVENLVDEIFKQIVRLTAARTIGKAISGGVENLLGGGIPDAPAPVPEPSAPWQFGPDPIPEPSPPPQFASGGSFEVAGSGGVDSEFVGFMATPGERVTVETPEQQRVGGGGGGGPTQQTVVHQKNELHMSTPSPREMRSVLRRHKGELWSIMREGVQKGML